MSVVVCLATGASAAGAQAGGWSRNSSRAASTCRTFPGVEPDVTGERLHTGWRSKTRTQSVSRPGRFQARVRRHPGPALTIG
jgi:hypothetical protein